MICGYCKKSVRRVRTLREHWKETGCPTARPVWAKVLEAHKRGTSGRRILSEAFPGIWKSEPMSEETKARLREIQERRKAEGIKVGRLRRRR